MVIWPLVIYGSWFFDERSDKVDDMVMVQGLKRQNGISKMKSINMGDDKKEKRMIVLGEHKEDVTLANIQARIFLVRGVQVMLDRDLAIFYKVETGQLNRQVKRNIGRFPEDFMFQLTKEEWMPGDRSVASA